MFFNQQAVIWFEITHCWQIDLRDGFERVRGGGQGVKELGAIDVPGRRCIEAGVFSASPVKKQLVLPCDILSEISTSESPSQCTVKSFIELVLPSIHVVSGHVRV